MATRRASAKHLPRRRSAASKAGTARRTPKRHVLPNAEPERFVGKYLHARAKMSSKGWVVIPKEIRDEMGLRPGDEVSMYLWPPSLDMKQDRGLYSLHVERVPEDPASLTFGMFKRRPGERPITELLLEERRREAEEEERGLPPPKKRNLA